MPRDLSPSSADPWPVPRLTIFVAVMTGLGLILATMTLSLLAGRFVDGVLDGNLPIFILIASAAIVLAKGALMWSSRMAAANHGAFVKPRLRQSIEKHIFRLGPQGTSHLKTGGVVHDAVEGVESLDVYYGLFIPQMFISGIGALLLCSGIFFLDPITGLVLLATTPLAPILMALMRGRFASVSRRYHAAANKLSADFLDSIQGLATLKIFNAGGEHGRQLRRRSETLRQETMRLLAINQIAIFLLDWGFALGATTACFVTVSLRYLSGALTVGEGMAVVLISVEIVRQFNLLGAFIFAGAGGRVMIRRIREFLAGQPAGDKVVAESSDAMTPANIRFEDVSFAYQSGEPVLDSVSFEVGVGESVALLGPSGTGKTTLAHLLLRFFDPSSGRIRLGDRNISELSPSDLRSRIAVVSQDTWLFHSTMAENLRMARQDATDEELLAVIRRAGLQDWFDGLPDGLATRLGERGQRLSGGQAQRIAIARALLKDAPVLILDEPTSHLDSSTEAVVLDALDDLASDRTVLHITHRASAARSADRRILLGPAKLAAVS